LLFNIRPLKSTDEVRGEIRKILARQKKGSADDVSAFQGEIEELLSLLEFKPEWKKLPVVARAARLEGAEAPGKVTPYSQDVVLPNTKHDLGLVTKMLNYMREQKQLQPVKQPLFVQPDEISLARKEGKINFEGGKIVSQVSVVLQKGAVMYVGFVFGRNYVILQN
jgi:hypothetical protein